MNSSAYQGHSFESHNPEMASKARVMSLPNVLSLLLIATPETNELALFVSRKVGKLIRERHCPREAQAL